MRIILLLVTLVSFVSAFAQTQSIQGTDQFPKPEFVLHDASRSPEKPRVELGPMHTDKDGKTTGTFAVFGGSSLIQVSSLSFSGDGKLLAIGSTPSIIDIWDVEKRAKLRSFEGGTAVALSPDGQLLATDGNGVEIWDVSSGKLKKRIRWMGGTIWRMSFDPSGAWVLVRANGENDVVFDVATGEKLATLANTQESQFSSDGSFVVGGNSKHLMQWNTKDWTPVRDLPNGPDYVTRFAVEVEKDLVVVGGPKSARLVRLSSGEEVAHVGDGYTNFAAFDRNRALIFTYTSSGFAVWDLSGRRLCGAPGVGNGTMALSPDGRWLAAGIVGGMTDVSVWKLESVQAACSLRREAKN
jgi:WD40 repeat protein